MENSEVSKILEAINNLYDRIDKVVKPKDKYESDQTNELNSALAQAYAEYPPITTNKMDDSWGNKYADFDCIMLKVRPILAKYGLTLMQRTIMTEDGSSYLQTRLYHNSGQWIETRIRVVPPKNDLHTYGSTKDYLKSKEAQDLLNITISDDPSDDNGAKAQNVADTTFASGTALNANYSNKNESHAVISKDQLQELEYELQEYPDIAEEVMEKLKIQSLAQMPKSRYFKSLENIRNIKRLREEHNIK